MRITKISSWILFSLLGLSACVSASRALEQGKYDEAIEKSGKVLQKEPANKKNLDILEKAYTSANTADQALISNLKNSGRPDIWDDVVNTYSRMKKRNSYMFSLPASVQNTIGFEYDTYDEDILAAKQKSAEYHYAKGLSYLETNTRLDARKAYDHFQKVISYFGNEYRDVNALLNEARDRGMTYALYKIENRSGKYLSPEAKSDLHRVYPEQLNSKWVIYQIEPLRNNYDYEVTSVIRKNEASPVLTRTVKKSYEKSITDGTEYKTDSKGKPVLDTAGNFIKVPRVIKVKCEVIESIHYKVYAIGGDIVYFETASQRWLRTLPFMSETKVSSSSFHIHGDTRALDKKMQEKIAIRPMPLPTDAEMMVMASIDASFKIREILSQNRRLIQ